MSDQPLEPDDGGVVLSTEAWHLLRRYETARRAEAMWAEERMKVREALADIVGDAGSGWYRGHKVMSVSRSRPRRFDSKTFSLDHPDLYERYRVEGEPVTRLTLAKDSGVEILPDDGGAAW